MKARQTRRKRKLQRGGKSAVKKRTRREKSQFQKAIEDLSKSTPNYPQGKISLENYERLSR